MVHGTSFIIPFPRTVHVGSYIRYSDMEKTNFNKYFNFILRILNLVCRNVTERTRRNFFQGSV